MSKDAVSRSKVQLNYFVFWHSRERIEVLSYSFCSERIFLWEERCRDSSIDFYSFSIEFEQTLPCQDFGISLQNFHCEGLLLNNMNISSSCEVRFLHSVLQNRLVWRKPSQLVPQLCLKFDIVFLADTFRWKSVSSYDLKSSIWTHQRLSLSWFFLQKYVSCSCKCKIPLQLSSVIHKISHKLCQTDSILPLNYYDRLAKT